MTYNLQDGPIDYQAVAASQTDLLVQGAASTASASKTGSYIMRVIVSVGTAATGTCSLKDGTTGGAIVLTAANTAIGVYSVPLQVVAKNTAVTPGWYVTTGAGATAVVVGHFQGA